MCEGLLVLLNYLGHALQDCVFPPCNASTRRPVLHSCSGMVPALGGPGLQQWKNQFEPELPLAWVIVLPLSELTRANATSSQIMAMSTRILLCLFPALCSYHYKNMIWAVAADQVIASSNENKYIFSPVVWKKAVSRAAGITHTTWQVFHHSTFLMS